MKEERKSAEFTSALRERASLQEILKDIEVKIETLKEQRGKAQESINAVDSIAARKDEAILSFVKGQTNVDAYNQAFNAHRAAVDAAEKAKDLIGAYDAAIEELNGEREDLLSRIKRQEEVIQRLYLAELLSELKSSNSAPFLSKMAQALHLYVSEENRGGDLVSNSQLRAKVCERFLNELGVGLENYARVWSEIEQEISEVKV